MKLSKSIIESMELIDSQKHVEELLSDGKPHEATFMNVVFLDGRSLSTDAFRPFVVEWKATNFDEFSEGLDQLNRAMFKTAREAYAPIRALASAAFWMMRAIESMHKGEPFAQEDWVATATLIGTATGLPDVELLEQGPMMPSEVNKIFTDYLESHPLDQAAPFRKEQPE